MSEFSKFTSKWQNDYTQFKATHITNACKTCGGVGWCYHLPEHYWTGTTNQPSTQEVVCPHCKGTGYANSSQQTSGQDTSSGSLHWTGEQVGESLQDRG